MAPNPIVKLLGLFRRRNVAFAMGGVMLTFAGGFTAFTYLRPFLESYARVNVTQLSVLLLGFGTAGFLGTYAASALVSKHLYSLLGTLAAGWAAVLLGLVAVRHAMWPVAILLVVWGALNAAVPVCWSTWLSQAVSDEPESGGGLMVGGIQLSIMTGGALGGFLLDNFSAAATFIGGALLLALATLTVGNGNRVRPKAEQGGGCD